MKKTLLFKIISIVLVLCTLNKGETLDLEKTEQINYMRFQNVDEVDMLETIIRKTRSDLFSEISHDIMN